MCNLSVEIEIILKFKLSIRFKSINHSIFNKYSCFSKLFIFYLLINQFCFLFVKIIKNNLLVFIARSSYFYVISFVNIMVQLNWNFLLLALQNLGFYSNILAPPLVFSAIDFYIVNDRWIISVFSELYIFYCILYQ